MISLKKVFHIMRNTDKLVELIFKLQIDSKVVISSFRTFRQVDGFPSTPLSGGISISLP